MSLQARSTLGGGVLTLVWLEANHVRDDVQPDENGDLDQRGVVEMVAREGELLIPDVEARHQSIDEAHDGHLRGARHASVGEGSRTASI